MSDEKARLADEGTIGPEASAHDPPTLQEEEAEVRRSWQVRRQLVRLRRLIKRSVLVLLALLVIVVALISQTSRGQALALRAALGRVQSELSGQLAIGGVHSGTLLAGATLTDVRLDAADGRPFMTADSIVVRYSLPSAVVGGSPIRSTVIWGLDLEISRYTTDQAMNVTRLLSERNAQTALPRSRDRRTPLGHVGIREGRVRVLTPASDPSRPDVVEGPQGEPLRELTLDDLDLDVEEAAVIPGAAVAFEARLASLSSKIGVTREPLVVDEVFGRVTFGELGLRVSEGRFRLPGGLVEGTVAIGPRQAGEPWILQSRLRTSGWVDLSAVQWLDPRVPDGRFRGASSVRIENGAHVDLDEVEVELEASNLVFDGSASFRNALSVRDMHVRAAPLVIDRLEPWIDASIPIEGWLSGEATFTGTLLDLGARGRVTLVPRGYGGGPTTAQFAGTIHRGAVPGASQFVAAIDPFNFGVLDRFWPDVPWAGRGTARVELDGRIDDGFRIDTDFTHLSTAGLSSAASVDGTVWRGAQGAPWITDLTVGLEPFAVGLLAPWAPTLGLRGTASGVLDLDGSLDAMSVRGDLDVGGGRVALESDVDLLAIAEGYRVELEATALPLALLSEHVPEETSWSGSLSVDGRGVTLEELDVQATGSADASRLGAVRVDSARAVVHVAGRVLTADSLRARVGGVDMTGRGQIGLAEGLPGDAWVDFSAESLVGLRPLLLGVADTAMVQDDLTELDREFLRLQGIEPDTLPSGDDVRLDGRMTGVASFRGDVTDFDIAAIAEITDARYKQSEVDTLQVAVSATDLPAMRGAWQLGATAFGIRVGGRTFQQGGFEADILDRGGLGRVELMRRPGEHYRAEGAFDLDSIGGSVDLNEASIEVGTDAWNLTAPTRVVWTDRTLTVDSLDVRRQGRDPMHMLVDGTLTRGGESDFRLRIEGLHAERVLHVAQLEALEVGGHLDLDLLVEGPSEAPRISSTFTVLAPAYGVIQLTRVDGSMTYADRIADFELQGLDGVRTAVSASGTFPLDLSLSEVEDRVPEGPMDVRISTDSLDAAVALSYLTSLEEVLGTVSGEIRVLGTPSAPEPEGVIRLANGEWSIEAIGVRHRGLGGEIRLRPDRTVDVSLQARGSGVSDVTGTVLLEPFRDPALNLTFDFNRFLAVSRADMEGFVSGSFLLTGRYTRPVARGTLTVDEGAIYVDELQRAAGVVDLSDPFLFESGLAVDTTALVSQPLFAGLRNPFFDNLRVDVDLSVPRGSWLRSIDTNVEMSGDLLVRYDRSANDFVLIGELEAVRGSHRVLGRTFELVGGTIGFFGRPGLNPDLDIQASTRVRRQDDPPLTVNAQVEGTLVQPVVTLTAEEAGLAEEDLISYLIFGQPSGDLGRRRGEALGQVGGTGVVSSAVAGTVTFLGGVLTNQFGSAIARELTLDYVSIQQGAGGGSLGADYVGDPQLEIGRYIGDDIFAVMVIRPFNAGPQDQNTVAGLRVEWALTDDYNVEGFLEDRFLRSGSSVLGTSAGLLENERIWGVFFFREWGYGRAPGPS